jgi:hypothetical protein
MKTAVRYLDWARRRARRELPPDFARRVIEDARHRRRSAAQMRLVAITGALCVIAAVATHLIGNRIVNQTNLAAWQDTAARTRIFEEAI